MILFSLGTHNQEFKRMAQAADKYAATTNERVVVQTGFTKFQFQHVFEHFDFCSKGIMENYMDQADILVLQGGWGGIREAIDKGKRIVVIPRINGIEHVHDQSQLTKKLEEIGCVLGVYDVNDLSSIIMKARTYEFKKLEKGNPEIIKHTLDSWFSN